MIQIACISCHQIIVNKTILHPYNTFFFVFKDQILLASNGLFLYEMNGTISQVINKDGSIQYVAYHESKRYIYWTSLSGNITRLVSNIPKLKYEIQNIKI